MKFKKTATKACAIALLASMVSSSGLLRVAAAEQYDEMFESFGVIGAFNQWAGDVAMNDDDGDGIWEAVVEIEEVTEDMVYSSGIEFKVRANGDWSFSWGEYEEEYDRTENSQTNLVIPSENFEIGEPLTFKVMLDTTGDDYELWPVSYTLDGGAQSETVEQDGFKFRVYEDYAALSSYSGSDSKVTVPSEISGVPVTKIGSSAFSNNSNIEEIILPDTIETIGYGSFQYCYSLKSVRLSSALKTIPENAFNSCSQLTDVSGMDNVESIGSYAFCGCSSLSSIELPEKLTLIGEYAFSSCSSLKTINIPESVTTINSGVFRYCSALESIVIPDSVTSIGEYAFSYCDSLTSVSLPSTLTIIRSYAFRYCSSLESITIPDSVTDIYSYAFANCTSLKEVTVPGSLTTVRNYTFAYCTALEKAVIEDGVKFLYFQSFGYCSSLNTILIPNSVTSIDDEAFYRTNVTILGETGSTAHVFAAEYSIPFADPAYPVLIMQPEGFAAVKYGNTVTIKSSASYGAGDYTFNYFYKKASSQNWTRIGSADTTDTEVSFKPGSADDYSVKAAVKDKDGNTTEKIIAVRAVAKDVVASGECGDSESKVYYYLDTEGTLTVFGEGKIKSYSGSDSVFYQLNHTNWDNWDEDGNYKGESPYRIKNIVIEKGVTSIGSYAFYELYDLKSVSIPDTVTKIEYDAFEYCSALEKAEIPSSVTSIGSYAFYGCNSMTIFGTSDSYAKTYADNNSRSFYDVGIPFNNTTVSQYAVKAGDAITLQTTAEYGSGSYSYAYYYRKTGAADWQTLKDFSADYTASFKVSETGTYELKAVVKDSANVTAEREFAVAVTDSEIVASGECGAQGSNVAYYLDKNHTLTIFGKGDIADYDSDESPFYKVYNTEWNEYDEETGEYIGESPYRIDRVIVADGITSVGRNNFYNINSIKTVELADSVTAIKSYAFYNLNQLTKVTVPESVSTIESYAFRYCSKAVIYGVGGSYINTYADENSLSFVDITMPVGSTGLNQRAVRTGESFTLQTSAEYGSGSYSYAYYYKKADAPDWQTLQTFSAKNSCTFTPDEAGIYDIKAVVKDSKDKSTEQILTVMATAYDVLESGSCGADSSSAAAYVFDKSETLTIFGSGAMADYSYSSSPFYQLRYKFVNNEGYDDETGESISGESYRVKNVVILDGITNVGNYAFYNVNDLKTVTLPDSVTKIGYSAFESCYGLEDINIPSSVTVIGDDAFEYCSSLNRIVLPESVTSISWWSFYGCGRNGFTVVGYPDSYAQEFAENRGYTFVDVTTPVNDSSISANTVRIGENITLTAAASYGSGQYTYTYYYKKAASAAWTKIGTADTTETTAVFKAGVKADYLARVVVKDSTGKTAEKQFKVRSVNQDFTSSGVCGQDAFYYLNDEGVLTIYGSGAMQNSDWSTSPFSNNQNIKTVVIEDGITTIGDYAFNYCRGLQKVFIPAGVTSISNSAFYNTNSFIVVGQSGSQAEQLAQNSNCQFIDAAVPQLHASLDNYVTAVGSTVTVSADTEYGAGGYTYNYYYKKSTSQTWTRIGTANTKEQSVSFKTGVKADYNVKVVVKDSKGVTKEKLFVVRSTNETFKASGECGTEGSAVSYMVSKDGILTIFGSGAMADYSSYSNEASPFRTLNGYRQYYDDDYYYDDYNEGNSSENNTYYSALVVEKGVTTIGNYSFYNVNRLERVSLSDTVTKIGSGAFADCYNLEKIEIPASVTEISSDAVSGNSYVLICGYADSAAQQYAAEQKYTFVDITKPYLSAAADKQVFRLGSSVSFDVSAEYGSGKYTWSCYYKTIGTDDWQTIIEDSSEPAPRFKPTSEGSYMVRIVVKDSNGKTDEKRFAVKATSESNFTWGTLSDDKTVAYLYVDDQYVTIFGEGDTKDYSSYSSPLSGNYDLGSIVVEEGVTGLGDYIFYDMGSVTSVTLPDSLKRIGSRVFHSTALSSVVIPASVESIGEKITGNTGFVIVGTPDTAAQQYASENDLTFVDITQPQNETSLAAYAVTVGDEVTIKAGASYGSGDYTYTYYYKKTTSATWTRIGDADTTQTTAYFKTGSKADYDVKVVVRDSSGKTSEKYLLARATTVRVKESGMCGNKVYYMLDSTGLLTIYGSGMMFNYNDSGNRSPFNGNSDAEYAVSPDSGEEEYVRTTRVKIEDGVTSIGKYVFAHMSYLETAVVGSTVKKINDYAFYSCPDLLFVEVPDAAKTIGQSALGNNKQVMVVANAGSYAETYASENQYAFADITKPVNMAKVSSHAVNIKDKITLTASARYGSGSYTYAYSYKTASADSWTAISNGYVSDTSAEFAPPAEGNYELLISVKDSKGQTQDKTFLVKAAQGSVVSSGSCSRDGKVSYMLDDQGVLTLFGQGKTDDYDWNTAPFHYNSNIRKVVIEDGITGLGNYLFRACDNLREVFVSDTVAAFGYDVLYDTYNPVIYANGGTAAESFADDEGFEFVDISVPQNKAVLDRYAVTVGDTVTINASAQFGSGDYTYNYFYKKAASNTWNRIGDADTRAESASFKTGAKGDYHVRVVVKDSTGKTAEKQYVVRSTTDTIAMSMECNGRNNSVLSCYVNNEGVLTVFGSGEMKDYSNSVLGDVNIAPVDYYDEDEGDNDGSDTAAVTPYTIKRIVIDSGVTYIGRNAFHHFSNVESVKLADTVTRVGYQAFEYCYRLKKTEIPASVTTFDSWAFGSCSLIIVCGYEGSAAERYAASQNYRFVDVTLPYNESTMDAYAKQTGERFTINAAADFGSGSYTYTYAYKKAADEAWTIIGTEDTSEISAELTLTEPGSYNVRVTVKDSSGNTSEKDFTIKAAVEKILDSGTCGKDEQNACMVDENGTLTIFGTGTVTDVDYVASEYNESIRRIVIEEGITAIGSDSCSGYGNATELVLPESLKTIEYDAFEYCRSLTRIFIPEGVESISDAAFANCGYIEVAGVPGTEAERFAEDNRYVTFLDRTRPYNLSECTAGAVKPGGSITVKAAAELGAGNYSYSYSLRPAGTEQWEEISNGYLTDDTFTYQPEKAGDYELRSTVKDDNGKISEQVFLFRVTDKDIAASGSLSVSGSTTAYMLDKEGTLTVFGKGDTRDYSWNTAPFAAVPVAEGEESTSPAVKAIVIEEGITSVGSYLFRECAAASLTLPESLKTIGSEAFSGCGSLQRVIVPETTVNIAYDAFENCSNLTICGYPGSSAEQCADNYGIPFIDITVPHNEAEISACAVKVGDTVTVKGAASFGTGSYTYDYFYKKTTSASWNRLGQAATSVQEVSFKTGAAADYAVKVVVTDSSGVKTEKQFIVKAVNKTIVASGSCGRNDSIVSYYIDDKGTLTVFGSGAMANGYIFNKVREKFTSVVIEKGITAVGNYNFDYYSDITSVTLPEGLKSIGNEAFESCYELKEITFPSTLLRIGGCAFADCEKLETVVLPDSVEDVGYSAFRSCDALTSIEFSDNITYLNSSTLSYCRKLKNVKLPAKLTGIGYDVFEECDALEELVFGDDVSEISDEAFEDARHIDLCGKSGSYVERYARSQGMTFVDVEIPQNKSEIDRMVVKAGGTVTIKAAAKFGAGSYTYTYYYKKASSKNWTLIGKADTDQTEAAFKAGTAADYNCKVVIKDADGITAEKEFLVKGVTMDVTASGKCGENAYYALDNTGTMTIFGSGEISYRMDDILPQYEESGNAESTQIKSVVIESGITAIGYSTFSNCRRLTSVSIPDTVTAISDSAFSYTGLTSVTIPASVQIVQDSAFYGCGDLQTVVLNEGLISINSHAFSDCDSLESLTLPASLESFNRSAVQYCTSMKAINVAAGSKYYASVDGVLYNKDKTVLVRVPVGYAGTAFTVPSGITTINDNAFRGCNSLKSIQLPDSVTTIGSSAFAYCENLESIYLPDSITEMGEYALDSCKSIKEVTFPSKLTYIPNTVCQSCTSLTKAVLPEKITAINSYAFNSCESLETIVIPESVTYIGEHAFSNTGISSLNLPEAVTEIDYGAFSNCRKLRMAELPSGLTSLGSNVFYGCSSLSTVSIPEGITSIGYGTFEQCTSLRSAVLPETLTTIGSYAFDHTKLADIYIPEAVNSISSSAFNNINGLRMIAKAGTTAEGYANEHDITFCDAAYPVNYSYVEPEVVKVGGVVEIIGDAAYGSGDYTYCYYYKKSTSKSWTTIGSGFTTNQSASFKTGTAADYDVKVTVKDSNGNTSDRTFLVRSTKSDIIESGTLGTNSSSVYYMLDDKGTLTIFGKGEISDYMPDSAVFTNRDNIFSVNIEDGVTSIGDYLFVDCRNLTSVKMADSVVSVGEGAFRNCEKLSSVTLSAKLQKLENYSFNLCKALKNITLPGTLTEMGGGVFYGCSALESITIPASLKYLNYGVFSGCTSLSSVTLPEGLQTLGGSCLAGCTSLRSINLPSTLEYLGYNCFSGCTALEEVTLPKSFVSFDYAPFNGCTSLKKINVDPENENFISVDGIVYKKDMTVLYMVPGNCGIKEFRVPDGVERITSYAFGGCTTLEKVTMPESVISVGYGVFSDCTSLKEVGLSGGMTELTEGCFRNCNSLQRILIPASIRYIAYEAFMGIDGLTIVGEAGSYAQNYAERNGFTFEVLQDKLVNNSSVEKAEVAVGEQVVIHGAASDAVGECSYAYYYKKSTRNTWTQIGSGFTAETTSGFKAGSESTYDIKVIVKDDSGKTAEKLLTVTAKKAASTALSNSSTISATEVSKGTAVTVSAKASGGTPSYSYAYYYKKSTSKSWTAIGSGYSTTAEASFTPAMAATYQVKVVVKDSTGSTSEKIFTVTSK